MISNILICTTQVPFTTGGAEAHVAGLRLALIEAGYNVEIVALPFKWYPPAEIMRGALAWRLLDLSEANGKTIDVLFGWIRNDDGVVRLVTAIPAKITIPPAVLLTKPELR